MKASIAIAVVGLLLPETSTGFPTAYIQSHIAQQFVGWAENVIELSSHQGQVCYDAPGVGFDLTATYAYGSLPNHEGCH